MSDYDKIIEIAKKNNFVFKTKMVVDAGIRKEKIKELLDQGIIYRVNHGWYGLKEHYINSYFEFQKRYPKAIFSYGTAAYFGGLIDALPSLIECTFPRGVNTSNVKTTLDKNFHYVTLDIYELGVTEVTLFTGEIIKLYDKERVVCDYIRHRKRCDIQIWGTVLNTYFRRRDKDLKKLIKYAKTFGILDELEMYVELLQ